MGDVTWLLKFLLIAPRHLNLYIFQVHVRLRSYRTTADPEHQFDQSQMSSPTQSELSAMITGLDHAVRQGLHLGNIREVMKQRKPEFVGEFN